MELDIEDKSSKIRMLCIDPGTTNLVACIFEYDNGVYTELWSAVFNVGKDPKYLGDSAAQMYQAAKKLEVELALVEYQAPIGPRGVSMKNTFVQGAISSCLSAFGMKVETVMPSVAKKKIGLATGKYSLNKRTALIYAKKKCPTIASHHEADCFILAEWWVNAKFLEEDGIG